MAKKFADGENLAELVAAGFKVRQAAETLSVSVAGAYKHSATPEFRLRVNELRTEKKNQAVGVLLDAQPGAVRTLVEIMEDKSGNTKPSDRIAAARAILGTSQHMLENMELRQRLDDLDKRTPEISGTVGESPRPAK